MFEFGNAEKVPKEEKPEPVSVAGEAANEEINQDSIGQNPRVANPVKLDRNVITDSPESIATAMKKADELALETDEDLNSRLEIDKKTKEDHGHNPYNKAA